MSGTRAIDRCPVPGDASRPGGTARFWAALEEVDDPELPISLVDLGLIYDVRDAGDGVVEVEMTFTAMGCPCVAFIREDVRERLLEEEGVREVRILEVWDPPWTRARMTETGRTRMREFGVAA